jgi:hypothetical protein
MGRRKTFEQLSEARVLIQNRPQLGRDVHGSRVWIQLESHLDFIPPGHSRFVLECAGDRDPMNALSLAQGSPECGACNRPADVETSPAAQRS